jgi:hypothetical protein
VAALAQSGLGQGVQRKVVKGDELGMAKAKGQSNYICQETELRVGKAKGKSNQAKRQSSGWPRPRDRAIRLRGRDQGDQGKGTE